MSLAALLRRLLTLPGSRPGELVAGAVAGFLCSASSIGLVATSAWLISRASERPPILSLTVAIVCVRFLGISRGVLRYAERLLTHDAGFRLLAALRVEVYRAVEPLAPVGLAAERSGDLLRRLVGDIDRIQVLVVRVAVPVAAVAATIVLATAVSGLVLPVAGGIVAAGTIVTAAGVPWICSRLAGSSAASIARLRGDLQAAVVDLLQGAPDLLAFGAVEAQTDRIHTLEARLCRLARRQAWVSALGASSVLLLAGLTAWASLVAGIPAVVDGRLDGTMLAVLALAPLAAFEPIASLPSALVDMREALGSAERVVDLLERVPLVRDPQVPAPFPEGTAISLDGIGVTLGARAEAALDGVDGVVAPGRRVVVTGPSGSGKTTLARALLRLVPLSAGRITLGGTSLDRLRQTDVRRRIGLCEDQPHLFATSLRENLRLARPDASDTDLRDAAARARVLEWIESLPHGWDTVVGERGVLLSGGQRRRLALARVLLADFVVLVLDEPTAHLDADTARAVMRDLLAATAGRTTIVITHDLDAVEDADEVWVMDAGRVVERRSGPRALPTSVAQSA